MTLDAHRTALLLVDIQPDFMPGGALAVGRGDEIVAPVRRLMEGGRFGLCVATQDWHPPGHVSFASTHGRKAMESMELYGHDQTLWPDHCIQGSDGAKLHEDLPWNMVSAIIRKGADPAVDSYSGFRDNWNAQGERPVTGLAGYLRARGVEEVYLCGLARDFCVAWSAKDAAAEGFRTRVLWDLSRPVDPASDDRVRGDLTAARVEILTVDEL